MKQKSSKPAQASKIRIIGGQWRGRKLPVGQQDGLRPTGDRMRETLFNWLMPWLSDARVLDAYAGTGALGFEALSRGAKACDFIENNPKTVTELRRNATLLNANANIHHCDFLRWRPDKALKPPPVYDIVLIDPPFAAGLWQATIEHIHSTLPLSPQAHIYIESPKQVTITVPANWWLSKQKTAGQTTATLFRLNDGSDDKPA